jgi:hypothetical protein
MHAPSNRQAPIPFTDRSIRPAAPSLAQALHEIGEPERPAMQSIPGSIGGASPISGSQGDQRPMA